MDGRAHFRTVRRLTVRDVLMPAASLVIVTTVVGLILFGTHALPAIALVLAMIVGGVAALLWYGARRGGPRRRPPDGLS